MYQVGKKVHHHPHSGEPYVLDQAEWCAAPDHFDDESSCQSETCNAHGFWSNRT